jgi:hypothetical protein
MKKLGVKVISVDVRGYLCGRNCGNFCGLRMNSN